VTADAVTADRFVWERYVRGDGEVTGTRLLVALVVATHVQNGHCSPGVAALVAQTGLCDSAVRKALRWLRERGWLTVIVRHCKGRTAVLGVTLPGRVIVAVDRYPGAAQEAVDRYPGAAQEAVDRYPGAAQEAVDRYPGAALSVGGGGTTTTTLPNQRPALALLVGPATALIDQLEDGMQPGSTADRRQMTAMFAQGLAHGWTFDQLAGKARLSRGFQDPVVSPPRMLSSMLGAMLTGPPRRRTEPWPAWCLECHEDTRLLDLDDGRVRKCPTCHPSLVAVTS
jgi:hypothetical protein